MRAGYQLERYERPWAEEATEADSEEEEHDDDDGDSDDADAASDDDDDDASDVDDGGCRHDPLGGHAHLELGLERLRAPRRPGRVLARQLGRG